MQFGARDGAVQIVSCLRKHRYVSDRKTDTKKQKEGTMDGVTKNEILDYERLLVAGRGKKREEETASNCVFSLFAIGRFVVFVAVPKVGATWMRSGWKTRYARNEKISSHLAEFAEFDIQPSQSIRM